MTGTDVRRVLEYGAIIESSIKTTRPHRRHHCYHQGVPGPPTTERPNTFQKYGTGIIFRNDKPSSYQSSAALKKLLLGHQNLVRYRGHVLLLGAGGDGDEHLLWGVDLGKPLVLGRDRARRAPQADLLGSPDRCGAALRHGLIFVDEEFSVPRAWLEFLEDLPGKPTSRRRRCVRTRHPHKAVRPRASEQCVRTGDIVPTTKDLPTPHPQNRQRIFKSTGPESFFSVHTKDNYLPQSCYFPPAYFSRSIARVTSCQYR